MGKGEEDGGRRWSAGGLEGGPRGGAASRGGPSKLCESWFGAEGRGERPSRERLEEERTVVGLRCGSAGHVAVATGQVLRAPHPDCGQGP